MKTSVIAALMIMSAGLATANAGVSFKVGISVGDHHERHRPTRPVVVAPAPAPVYVPAPAPVYVPAPVVVAAPTPAPVFVPAPVVCAPKPVVIYRPAPVCAPTPVVVYGRPAYYASGHGHSPRPNYRNSSYYREHNGYRGDRDSGRNHRH